MEKNKLVKHEEFLKRIRKSLYYGGQWDYDEMDLLSKPLAEITADMFSEPHKRHSLNRLNIVTVGNIINTTPCSLILSMIYLERLNGADPFYAKKITPTELFLVSMMVSTKFYQGYDDDVDEYNTISDWAKYGDIISDRLKELEIGFLNAIQWNLHVSNDEFFAKLKTVENILAKKQALNRGWLTYTELEKFLPSISLAKQLINYSTIMLVSYACSFLTLTGAFLLASRIPYTHLYNKANSASISTRTFDHKPMETNQTQILIDGNGTNDLTESNILDVSFDENPIEDVCDDCYDIILFNNTSTQLENIKFQMERNWKKYSVNDQILNCSSLDNQNFWPSISTIGKNNLFQMWYKVL